MKQLSKSFFARDTVLVAQELLGKIISIDGMQGRIVETEAYGTDAASHAFKKTDRSKLMYNTYGHVYVYLIYGMYNCLNFTTEKDDAGAVLIRAIEPSNGIKEMKERRKTDKLINLCSGPGKLCIAFNITKDLNGLPLGNKVKVYDDNYVPQSIGKSSRIGIKDALHLEWRFFIEGNEHVSR